MCRCAKRRSRRRPRPNCRGDVHGGRVQVIVMTQLIYDSRLCRPGAAVALVNTDFRYLTEAFSPTLGPIVRGDIALLAAGSHE